MNVKITYPSIDKSSIKNYLSLRLFLLFFLILNISALAKIRYVSKTGSSIPPYTSWASAADSIQKCINISSFGDTIYVGEGTYQEFVRMSEGLSLIGTGYDNCNIDGRNLGIINATDVLINLADSCLISGFKIIVSNYSTAHSSYNGHAINVNTDSVNEYSTIIRNNIICKANYGIRTSRTHTIVKENIFSDCEVGIIFNHYFLPFNYTVSENIIHATSTGVSSGIGSISNINNNVFYLEKMELTTASRSNGELDFYNNLIISETYNSIGATNSSFRTNIINNTLIGHFWRGIGVHDNNVIKNNVLISGRRGLENESINTTIQYNCLWDFETIAFPNPLDSTNIIADPMFVDTSNENYYLQMFSPCIDSGDPTILDVDGTRSDMGVYGGPFGESYTYQDLAPRPPVNVQGEIIEGNKVRINWNPNTESDFYEYKIYKDTTSNFVISPFNLISTISDTLFIEPYDSLTSLYYKVTAIDSTGNESLPGEEVAILVTGINEIKIRERDFQLYQNYPNPFNPSTNISFYINETSTVKLNVYDSKGEMVTELINEELPTGYHKIEFPRQNDKDKTNNELASGVYVYSLSITGKDKKIRHSAKKMMLLK